MEIYYPIHLPFGLDTYLGEQIAVRTTATITDPVEYIRTLHVLREYGEELSSNREQATEILKQQREKERRSSGGN